MNTDIMFSSEKSYWETPQKLFNELDAEFHFTLDAAASDENHKCTRYFTQEDDGLQKNWGAKRYFATRLMAVRKPACGRRNAIGRGKRRGQRWCC